MRSRLGFTMYDEFLLTIRLYEVSNAFILPTRSVSHSRERSAVIIAYILPLLSYNGFE